MVPRSCQHDRMATDGTDRGVLVPSAAAVAAAPGRFVDHVARLSTVGVGGLPHRDEEAAAAFSVRAFDVLTLPSLPRRSPAEAPVAQALVGAPGITMGQYGAVSIDVSRLDPEAEVRTELRRDEFTGFRACLEHAAAAGHSGPVKWQFVGPISVGVTLRRAGVPAEVAFALAARLVRCHLRALVGQVRDALPSSTQLVVLDEPLLDDVMTRDFPIAPDEAVDLLSSSMAAVCGRATVGVHTCGSVDLSTLIAAGPDVLSIPVRASLPASSGYIDRFLANGGWIVWGAVPTEGPIASVPARSARSLRDLWSELAGRGCDAERLRAQALVSPQCGLGGLSSSVAENVCSTTAGVARALLAG